jgi:hypothetical protein
MTDTEAEDRERERFETQIVDFAQDAAPADETSRREAIVSGDRLGGLLSLFAEHGKPSPVDLDPTAEYRVTIEQVDGTKPATADTYTPYDPPRRRVTNLRSDQMGERLARYIPHSDCSPVVLDPGAIWRVTIERVEPTTE